MRVAFLGNDSWSVPTLHALADAGDVEVVLVVTNPPKPAGRGSRLTPTPVSDAARALDLELLEADRVRDGIAFEALDSQEPDAIVVVAYGEILTPDVLDIPRLGAVNVHFSLLPRWRGAAPVQRTILAGDDTTGVTVMLMDEGMDTGPILAAEESEIGAEEDAGSLGQRLSELGATLLVETLRKLEEASVEPRSQDHTTATYAPKVLPDERTIHWDEPADAVVRTVRALAPAPGAVTTFRQGRVKVLAARTVPERGMPTDASSPSPGAIQEWDRNPLVAAWPGLVELVEVAPAGRTRMTGADWARGARIRPGERLG